MFFSGKSQSRSSFSSLGRINEPMVITFSNLLLYSLSLPRNKSPLLQSHISNLPRLQI